jgi:hypothetical protein
MFLVFGRGSRRLQAEICSVVSSQELFIVCDCRWGQKNHFAQIRNKPSGRAQRSIHFTYIPPTTRIAVASFRLSLKLGFDSEFGARGELISRLDSKTLDRVKLINLVSPLVPTVRLRC